MDWPGRAAALADGGGPRLSRCGRTCQHERLQLVELLLNGGLGLPDRLQFIEDGLQITRGLRDEGFTQQERSERNPPGTDVSDHVHSPPQPI